MAEDLEIPYYESSVFTPFGIDTVFQNVIRVALLHRRQQRFWFNHLKSVQQPTLQDPYCPKKPLSPEIQVGRSTCVEQMTLFHEQMPLADVRLLTAESGEPISSHRMMLSIASDVFARLFQRVASVSPTELEQHFRCDQSTLHFNSNSNDMSHSKFKMFAVDQSNCQSCFRSKISSLEEIFSEAGDSSLEERSRLQSISDEVEFDHPAFSSLKILTRVKENVAKCCDSWCDQSRFVYQVQLSDQICREALQRCILFAYTGSLGDHQIPLDQLMLTAELLQFNDVIKLIQQALTDQNHSSSVCASIAYRNLMHDWSLQQLNKTLNHLHRTALNSEFTGLHTSYHNPYFTLIKLQLIFVCRRKDVIFQLDDGRVSCHKPILVARCEMMGAMFTSNFRESSLRVVS